MAKYALSAIAALLVIEIIIILIVAYSGIPDIAATKPENRFLGWFLSTVKDNSIQSRAKDLPVPPLGDSMQIAMGFDHYNDMCVSCHGAPGRKAEEFAMGLNPPPPNLAFSTRDMEPSEMFVVIKDGIKMTGMPGFSPTHTDTEIWAMVAFLKRMQTMSPEEYSSLENIQDPEGVDSSEQHHGSMK